MTVVLHFSDGSQRRLDRNLWTDDVAAKINAERAKGGEELLPFQNDDTPSQTIYVDANLVMRIENDR